MCIEYIQNAPSKKPEVSLSAMLPTDRMLGSDSPLAWGESEATTHLGDDSTCYRRKGGGNWGEKRKAYPNVQSSKAAIWYEREMGAEMCIFPIFSQKRIFEDWIGEIDSMFRNFDKWPISEVLGHMIEISCTSDCTRGRDAWV